MKLLESLLVNKRDLAGTILLIIGILVSTNIITSLGGMVGIDLSDTRDFVFAAAKFAAVALFGVGYLTHVTFRQSLGEHDVNEFMTTWNNLAPKERLEWYFRLVIAGLVSASIVFGIGV